VVPVAACVFLALVLARKDEKYFKLCRISAAVILASLSLKIEIALSSVRSERKVLVKYEKAITCSRTGH
jgi:hypothetical protein